MFETIICFLLGHRWSYYPENTSFHDYKVCDRCSKSIALSPYLTRGEVEYIDRMFVDAVNANLISRNPFWNEGQKTEVSKDGMADFICLKCGCGCFLGEDDERCPHCGSEFEVKGE